VETLKSNDEATHIRGRMARIGSRLAHRTANGAWSIGGTRVEFDPPDSRRRSVIAATRTAPDSPRGLDYRVSYTPVFAFRIAAT
jgi:hypothetical protein